MSSVKKFVMSTSVEIGLRPTDSRRSASHLGDGPFLRPRKWRPTNSGQWPGSGSSKRTPTGDLYVPATLATGIGFNVPMPAAARSRAMPRTPRQSARLGRDRDVDDRVVVAEKFGERLADGRVGGKIDDAVMVLAEAHLAHRHEHAVGRLPADLARFQQQARARNRRADGREHALHAGARVGRTADDLHDAGTRIDRADAQPVGVGMGLGFHDEGDLEGGPAPSRGLRCLRVRGRSPSAPSRCRRARRPCRDAS